MKNQNVCFYHSADLDGHASGAIVFKYLNGEVQMKPIDYGAKIECSEYVGRTVYIVDFSFKEDVMLELDRVAHRVVWIDHHESAMRMEKVKHLPGIRSTKHAACALAWEYFFPGSVIPTEIEYLSLYDSWQWIHHNKYYDILYFQLGMNSLDTYPVDAKQKFWHDNIFRYDRDSSQFIHKIISAGMTIYNYVMKEYSRRMSNAPVVMFDGYKSLLITGYVPSWMFEVVSVLEPGGFMRRLIGDEKSGRPRIAIIITRTTHGWKVSLRTEDSTIDVGDIAGKFGGGGHVGAAGFHCTELPFDFQQVEQ